MAKKIIITGATGLIGTQLCRKLSNRGNVLTIFTRDPVRAKRLLPFANEFVKWNYKKPEEWTDHLNSKDTVIHLAGTNLAGRIWTKDYKKKISESRELSTRNIVTAISKTEIKPKTFICASGVNYYGDNGDKILTEESVSGNDFLSRVCSNWENEAKKVEIYGVRRVSVRTGPFLSPLGGALKKFLIPFKLFVGGPLGTGEQWFSWIHPEDGIRAYLFLLDNESIDGAVNLTSPNPVRMKELAEILGKILNRPSFFRVPEVILKTLFGEMSITVTESLRVVPQKLSTHNFQFQFNDISLCLKDLLKENN